MDSKECENVGLSLNPNAIGGVTRPLTAAT